MTAKDKNLNDLFHDTLKDIYYAERKIVKSLPKMAKARTPPSSRRRSKSTTARPRATSNASSRCSS